MWLNTEFEIKIRKMLDDLKCDEIFNITMYVREENRKKFIDVVKKYIDNERVTGIPAIELSDDYTKVRRLSI